MNWLPQPATSIITDASLPHRGGPIQESIRDLSQGEYAFLSMREDPTFTEKQ